MISLQLFLTSRTKFSKMVLLLHFNLCNPGAITFSVCSKCYLNSFLYNWSFLFSSNSSIDSMIWL